MFFPKINIQKKIKIYAHVLSVSKQVGIALIKKKTPHET